MGNSVPYQTPDHPTDFGKIRWATIFGGLVGLALSNVFATQYIASRFFYSAALGEPMLSVFGTPIYAPWKWALWVAKYTRSDVPYVKNTTMSGLSIVLVGSALVLLAAMYSNFLRSRKVIAGGEHIHGSARFATVDDLEKNGIIKEKKGVYIGAFRDNDFDHYLRHNGPEHIFVFAPTRSGKGVGIVIPSLLGWEESTIVYDIKGENWALTSGYRAAPKDKGGLGQTCLKFAPVEEDTAHFNPFDLIRFGTDKEVADTQNIANLLLDLGDNPSDRYFLDEAVSLASGLILHLLYESRRMGYRIPSPASLLEVATDPEGAKSVLERIMSFQHRGVGDPPFPGVEEIATTTHPVIAGKMAKMLAKGDKEFGSVLGSLTRPLEIYSDPRVRRATSFSDFTIYDLVNHPTSLYIVIPPSDKIRLKPLIRTILTLTVNRLTEKMDFDAGATKKNKYRLLFLIDEFPQLGNMQEFASALAYMAGYGCKALLIAQDIEQLKDRSAYGEHEPVTPNCHVRIAYAPNTQKTAELLSQMTGKTTIQQQTLNISGSRTSSGQNQMSTTISYVARDLLTPAEVSALKKPVKINQGTSNEKIVGPGSMLIFFAGEHPILGVQILYFLNKSMLAKTTIHCPATSHLTDEFPKTATNAGKLPPRPHRSKDAMRPATLTPNSSASMSTTQIQEPADSHVANTVPQNPKPVGNRFAEIVRKIDNATNQPVPFRELTITIGE
jgi:type IV secretion system protein VirD4